MYLDVSRICTTTTGESAGGMHPRAINITAIPCHISATTELTCASALFTLFIILKCNTSGFTGYIPHSYIKQLIMFSFFIFIVRILPTFCRPAILQECHGTEWPRLCW